MPERRTGCFQHRVKSRVNSLFWCHFKSSCVTVFSSAPPKAVRSLNPLPVESLTESVVRYHGTSIHVDHAMSTGNQSVSGRRWNGGADGTVVQMERWCRWNGGADGNTPNGFLIFEKNFTGFVGPPSPSTLCAGPAYPHRSIQPREPRQPRQPREPREPGISSSPGSAAARAPGLPGSAAAQAARAPDITL